MNERYLKLLPAKYVTTATKAARTLDSERGRRSVECFPEPLLASCVMSDSAGCMSVTIGLPDLGQPCTRLVVYPLHMCEQWFALTRSFAFLRATEDPGKSLFQIRRG